MKRKRKKGQEDKRTGRTRMNTSLLEASYYRKSQCLCYVRGAGFPLRCVSMFFSYFIAYFCVCQSNTSRCATLSFQCFSCPPFCVLYEVFHDAGINPCSLIGFYVFFLIVCRGILWCLSPLCGTCLSRSPTSYSILPYQCILRIRSMP